MRHSWRLNFGMTFFPQDPTFGYFGFIVLSVYHRAVIGTPIGTGFFGLNSISTGQPKPNFDFILYFLILNNTVLSIAHEWHIPTQQGQIHTADGRNIGQFEQLTNRRRHNRTARRSAESIQSQAFGLHHILTVTVIYYCHILLNL